MSVATLAPPSSLEQVTTARAAVAQAAQVPAAELSTPELEAAVAELAALESQVSALRLAYAAEADDRGVAAAACDTGTDAWLARLTGEPREVMAGGLWIARLLRTRYHHTREALAQGRLRLAQAKVVVRAAERAPAGVTDEQRADAEASLVAMATGEGTRSGRPMDARRLRQQARRMFDGILPADQVDRIESDQLQAEESRAEAETHLWLHDNGDGTCTGRFTLPELHGSLLRTALDRLSAPRQLSRDRAGRPVTDPTAAPTGRAELLGAAFCELIEHLPTDGHAPATTRVLVTVPLASLQADLGAARLDTGVHVSATQARRLACEAGILPAVLGGAGQPLDLGRSRRLHSPAQRAALATMFDTCAVAGCERPFAWTEIHHHRRAWSAGGRTDLDNALPLCAHHHRRAHDPRWELRPHDAGEHRFHRRSRVGGSVRTPAAPPPSPRC